MSPRLLRLAVVSCVCLMHIGGVYADMRSFEEQVSPPNPSLCLLLDRNKSCSVNVLSSGAKPYRVEKTTSPFKVTPCVSMKLEGIEALLFTAYLLTQEREAHLKVASGVARPHNRTGVHGVIKPTVQ
eukprot:6770289-Pyramimonas_sp.AAC.1